MSTLASAHMITEHDLLSTYNMLVRYVRGDYKEHSHVGLCHDILCSDFPSEVLGAWAGKRCYIFPIEGNHAAYVANNRKHDRRTTYGKMRLELAKFCLEWVEGQLTKAR